MKYHFCTYLFTFYILFTIINYICCSRNTILIGYCRSNRFTCLKNVIKLVFVVQETSLNLHFRIWCTMKLTFVHFFSPTIINIEIIFSHQHNFKEEIKHHFTCLFFKILQSVWSHFPLRWKVKMHTHPLLRLTSFVSSSTFPLLSLSPALRKQP